MNKLLKVALIGGSVIAASQVGYDLGTTRGFDMVRLASPNAYEKIIGTISDILKYRKCNAIEKARLKFILSRAEFLKTAD